MCPIPVQFCFQQPVDQQCGITDHEVGNNTFRLLMVNRTCRKVCLHHPEAVLDLIPVGADFDYGFCRVIKVVTMPPVAAQMMMKAVDFLLLVPYPSDLLYPYSGDTSTLQSTL